VTSTDRLSYPILDITGAPEAVDIVLINHPELPPRPVAAALANAVFDATGVRVRRATLTSKRLKPALA
jgi:CO/xanthine dehydrogenase Mo-binding subunit